MSPSVHVKIAATLCVSTFTFLFDDPAIAQASLRQPHYGHLPGLISTSASFTGATRTSIASLLNERSPNPAKLVPHSSETLLDGAEVVAAEDELTLEEPLLDEPLPLKIPGAATLGLTSTSAG